MKKKITHAKSKASKKPKSRSTSIYPIPLTIALVLIILSGYYVYRTLLSSSITPIQIAEIKNATGTVNLNLNSTLTSLSPNQETTVALTYDSPTDKLTVISGEISYDPAILTVSNFVKGDGFPTELAAANATNGKITFTYGVAVAAGSGLTGQGNVLTFKVKSKAVGSSTLAITDATQLYVVGKNNNALREITNTTLTVTDPNASPSVSPSTPASTNPSTTPSTSPSVTPSTAPSVTPSVKPSLEPSSSPSTSPDPTSPTVQKPSSPTNLKYNCYSNGNRITLRWDTVNNSTSYEITLNQKDGGDNQTKTSTRPEIDLEIKSNTAYDWQVSALNDGVKSEPTTIKDIKCSGELAQNNSTTPTPTPTPTPDPTPTPTPSKLPITQQIANIFKPKSPSPTPTVNPTLAPVSYTTPDQNSTVLATPTPTPGSLSDIFATTTPTPTTTPSTNTNIFSKILLGWQALFIRFIESLTN